MEYDGNSMDESDHPTVFTIGHSTHEFEAFAGLLRAFGISAVADVRSEPYSRFSPQYNRETLKEALTKEGIAYSFLGKELGGRPANSTFFKKGVADYERMAKTDVFRQGLGRVIDGAGKYRIALMCSEQDPLDCHRCLLVGRALKENGLAVRHILAEGTALSQQQVEERLIEAAGGQVDDLFASRDEKISDAYRLRSFKVAFPDPAAKPLNPAPAA
jgi:uncharacterized protein (DUF488 family)